MWVTWSKGHMDLREGASPSKSAPYLVWCLCRVGKQFLKINSRTFSGLVKVVVFTKIHKFQPTFCLFSN